MRKYDGLAFALQRKDVRKVLLTFTQIEVLMGFELPNSARTYLPWWRDNGTSHRLDRAWLEAGYKASEFDLEAEAVTFLERSEQPEGDGKADPDRHPFVGCMKGTITVADGVDPTESAMGGLAFARQSV